MKGWKKRDQDIQGNWVKVEKSSFCSLYKEDLYKEDKEEYWDRRGNIGK